MVDSILAILHTRDVIKPAGSGFVRVVYAAAPASSFGRENAK
jgi:hypothetical protein